MVRGKVLELGKFGFRMDLIRVQGSSKWDRLVFFWFFIFFLVGIGETKGYGVSWGKSEES